MVGVGCPLMSQVRETVDSRTTSSAGNTVRDINSGESVEQHMVMNSLHCQQHITNCT